MYILLNIGDNRWLPIEKQATAHSYHKRNLTEIEKTTNVACAALNFMGLQGGEVLSAVGAAFPGIMGQGPQQEE